MSEKIEGGAQEQTVPFAGRAAQNAAQHMEIDFLVARVSDGSGRQADETEGLGPEADSATALAGTPEAREASLRTNLSATQGFLEAEYRLRSQMADEIVSLRARVKAAEAERDEWKALAERINTQIRPLDVRCEAAEAREAAALARIGELEAALKPFGDAAEFYDHSHDDAAFNARPGWAGKDYLMRLMPVRLLRRARTLTNPQEKTDDA